MQIDIAGSEVKYVPATHKLDVEQSKHDVADVSETSTDNSIGNIYALTMLDLIQP